MAQSQFFFILSFLTLTMLVQSRLTLLPRDRKALSLILKDLNIPQKPNANSCNSIDTFCERRKVNSTHFLRITRLVFDHKNLNGRLSPAIGQLSELKELSLHNNQLIDQIPPQIINCNKLEVLNLENNMFSGVIPDGFSSLVRLRILDLSSNAFTGNLKFLKHFPNMEKLDLADNMFSGKVPVSLRSFRNLRFVNMSGNSLLEGNSIPLVLNDRLDDQFSSELLTGDIETAPKRYIFAENSPSRQNRSYTAHAPGPAPSPLMQPREERHHKHTKRMFIRAIGFIAGTITGLLFGFLVSLLYRALVLLIRGRGKDHVLKIFSPLIKKPEDLAFLEKEDGLASLTVIGKGGCGEVYKAVLPGSNGKEIAIKKVIQPPVDADELSKENSRLLTKKMRQIKSEIDTVGKIRHKNLLPLLAHYPGPNCHYLVYEYMKNGSLQDYLLRVAAGQCELDWLARYRIALGLATGLEYLHVYQSPRIIHRDLKPANVLLDDDMEARITDFGLAKAIPDANTHITSSNVAGTLGYIAPEYYLTLKFTDKCDVYSFGVVLGILVMGKFPSDSFFQNTEEMMLVKWMRSVMSSEDPKRAIDEKLLGNGYEEQMLLVLKVACFCTLDNPKERPNSKEAKIMLSQIKH